LDAAGLDLQSALQVLAGAEVDAGLGGFPLDLGGGAAAW
jgi:hypothetical protein